LSLGEKFGVPANLRDSSERLELTVNFVKNFEASTPKLPEKMVDKARSMMVNSLCRNLSINNHLSYFDTYINREVKKCKKFLKNNPEIFVTKADKGQVTVVMDRNVYVDKMTQMLEDTETYKPIKTNPLPKINSKLNNLIKGWYDSKAIDEWRYKCLKCTNGNLPRCYGLPKIHKREVPLRIVVSSVGSPLFEVAKFLHNILNISIKKPTSHVKDSWSFVGHIKEKSILPDEILVSFDVTSLFTNLPKELILRGIENRWQDIEKNTKLVLPQFLNAIDLLLSSACFSYNDKYYSQIYGSPMGSPLSPILADIVLDDLETWCLQKLDFSIHTYYRYVDDIFMIIPATKLLSVLDVFNNYHPRLKFTYEVEVNNNLNFLDVSVIRMNGKLITNWFRKPTFSGRYINFHSNHPLQYKLNSITNLVDHAILLSNERFHDSNLTIVKNILINNGYPIKLINRQINNRCKYIAHNRNGGNNNDNMNNKNGTLLIPYAGKVSYDIKRILNNVLDVRFTIPRRLDTLIKKGKDSLKDSQLTEVVYKLNCKDCDKAYVGQTKRHVGTRIKEHFNNIKSTSNYSVVTNHRLSFNHDFEWDKPNILHRERNRKKRALTYKRTQKI